MCHEPENGIKQGKEKQTEFIEGERERAKRELTAVFFKECFLSRPVQDGHHDASGETGGETFVPSNPNHSTEGCALHNPVKIYFTLLFF